MQVSIIIHEQYHGKEDIAIHEDILQSFNEVKTRLNNRKSERRLFREGCNIPIVRSFSDLLEAEDNMKSEISGIDRMEESFIYSSQITQITKKMKDTDKIEGNSQDMILINL